MFKAVDMRQQSPRDMNYKRYQECRRYDMQIEIGLKKRQKKSGTC